MGLPTLEELGIKDNRKKIPVEVKTKIKQELDNGFTNMTALAKKYNVSVCTVRMIRNPEHEKALIKKSREKRKYYNKDKQKEWVKKLQDRKLIRIREILKEYNK
jgi:hypothetical protein